jgi:hypothetical protein
VALDGFSLHAGVRIHEHDREGLERLCRYAVRPPFALHRLSQGPDGNLLYRMKRARGGSLFLLLTPDQLLTRIATLVPGHFQIPGRSPAALQPVVAPTSPSVPSPFQLSPQPAPVTGDWDRLGPRYRVPWAELLRKVFSEATLRSGQGTALPWGRRQAQADILAEHRGDVATPARR